MKLLALVSLALCAAAVAGLAMIVVRAPATTAEMRGYEVAVEMGCFACHGDGGEGGLPNPGGREEWIPGLAGVAAPVFYRGRLLAALAVSGSAAGFSRDAFTTAVRAAAQRISRSLEAGTERSEA